MKQSHIICKNWTQDHCILYCKLSTLPVWLSDPPNNLLDFCAISLTCLKGLHLNYLIGYVGVMGNWTHNLWILCFKLSTLSARLSNPPKNLLHFCAISFTCLMEQHLNFSICYVGVMGNWTQDLWILYFKPSTLSTWLSNPPNNLFDFCAISITCLMGLHLNYLICYVGVMGNWTHDLWILSFKLST